MQPKALLQVATKELSLFFSSPIAYLFLAAYLGVTLFVFFWGEAFFARNIADVRPMFEWLPILLIFLAAALTMRTWSDERRTGTVEFLITLPATSWDLTLGKFLACFILLCVALLLTLPLPVFVSFVGNLDWGPVLAGYAAAILLGSSYLSIGLFISAKTENQIVALILTTFICGVFFFLGSSFLTELFSNTVADILRLFGSGSRFESITRGVIDIPDLYFYIAVTATFLALNVFALGSIGWAKDGDKKRHVSAMFVTGLLCANLLVANVWFYFLNTLRWDVTQGDQYSISEVSKQYLSQLREPLLVRGYFSAKTHPLLAPLVPQVKDLLKEYQVAGGDRVRIELVDPIENPELEDEANTKYGIRPVPFQTADRYQSSLVNSYFDVLIKYGDEYEVLGFRDLIEVKVRGENDIDVRLKNPEFDLTRTIKKVLSGFQKEGSVFDFISVPTVFAGYISDDSQLPPQLVKARKELGIALDELKKASNGSFTWAFHDPEENDGEVAAFIRENYGFQPMAASLFETNTFYFYLTINDGESVLSISLPDSYDAESFKRNLKEGLQRFASGLLKSVALHTPGSSSQHHPGRSPQADTQFTNLRTYLEGDYDVTPASLLDPIPTTSSVLLVVAPRNLSDKQVFAIDQYLMRGGTVIIAAGAFQTSLTHQYLNTLPGDTGLEDWLGHHGVSIEKVMVLDQQNTAFPVPVSRQVGAFTFQEIRMLDYPFFVDIRGDGFVGDSPITRDLNQVTFAWGSPIKIDDEKNHTRAITELLKSSASSWMETQPDVMPKIDQDKSSPYAVTGELDEQLVGVVIGGVFNTYFEESPLIEETEEKPSEDLSTGLLVDGKTNDAAEKSFETHQETDTLGEISGVIARSPESARLIVIGSSDFIADQTIRMISSTDGTFYTNSIQLMTNLVDWSVEDTGLLSIRSGGYFNRTLDPLASEDQQFLEYLIYTLAVLGLVAVFLINWWVRLRQRSNQVAWLRESA